MASVIVDNKLRGKGYGREMIQLALRYAFEITGAELVQLNVFIENQDAKRCYESIGFVERCITKDAFVYKDEAWSRCNMTIAKQKFKISRVFLQLSSIYRLSRPSTSM